MASLTLREAVEAALEHFEANADLLKAADSQNVTFEEAELSENGAYWQITLGYPIKKQNILGMELYERKYIIFVINSDLGTLKALKMRPDVEPTPL